MAVSGLDTAQMMQEIRGKKEELYKKILKGETQPKFQTGAEAYTVKEWERLLDKFDETQEDIREALEEEKEEQGKTRVQHTTKKPEEKYREIAELMSRKIK